MKINIEIPPDEFDRRCAEDDGLKAIEAARGKYRALEQRRYKGFEAQVSEQFAIMKELNAQKRALVYKIKQAQANIMRLREHMAYRPAPMRRLDARERKIKQQIRKRIIAEATARAAREYRQRL